MIEMSRRSRAVLFLVFSIFSLSSCQKGENGTHVYEPVKVSSEWFRVSYLGERIYCIEEPESSQGNVSYLILGDKRALMFDTGSGENEVRGDYKIKYLIEKITSLPVTLIQSHFHFDHNQNIHEFEHVAFPDLPDLRGRVTEESIFYYSQEDLFYGDYPSQVRVDEWFPMEADIDLGDQIIRLIHIPGHSNESIAILLKNSKLALLGDFLYNGTLFLFHQDDLAVYGQTVDHLSSLLTSEYKLYGAHGVPEIEYEQLQKLKDFLVCIEEENCDYIERTVWGIPALVYKYLDMSMLIFQQ